MDDLKNIVWKDDKIIWNEDQRYFMLYADFDKEHQSVRSFFHIIEQDSTPSKRLQILESALQTRSFSKPSDEPLCISTLMDLDITEVISKEGAEARMRVVWDLLAKKFTGIPASIIFYEDNCLSFPSFRWAPRSFSRNPGSQFSLTDRWNRWASFGTGLQLGLPTKNGMKLRFHGFKLTPKVSPPLNPWRRGLPFTVTRLLFQDDKGTWYHLFRAKKASSDSELRSPEFMRETREDAQVMMNALHAGNCAVVLHGDVGYTNGLSSDVVRGILVKTKEGETEDGILAERKMHVYVANMYADHALVLEALKRLALRIRDDELTTKLATIADEESAEYKEILEEIKKKMKEAWREALQADSNLRIAVARGHGANFVDDM
jgi:hypothetical protein